VEKLGENTCKKHIGPDVDKNEMTPMILLQLP
jgi:hypothetical protein